VILSLETSTAASSAAVVAASGTVRGESRQSGDPLQSRRLLEGVHAALGEAGASLADVSTVVCGLGPGAFTGLRIGVATARALAQAAGVEVGGVPTLEALARGLAAGEAGASATMFVPLVDGRRNEVFAAVYRRAAHGAQPSGWPALELEAPLAVVRADELTAFLSDRPGAVVGGDGAVLYADLLPPGVVRDRAVAAPTAVMVARTWLAGSSHATAGFARTLPIYGRGPDAVPRRGAGAA